MHPVGAWPNAVRHEGTLTEASYGSPTRSHSPAECDYILTVPWPITHGARLSAHSSAYARTPCQQSMRVSNQALARVQNRSSAHWKAQFDHPPAGEHDHDPVPGSSMPSSSTSKCKLSVSQYRHFGTSYIARAESDRVQIGSDWTLVASRPKLRAARQVMG